MDHNYHYQSNSGHQSYYPPNQVVPPALHPYSQHTPNQVNQVNQASIFNPYGLSENANLNATPHHMQHGQAAYDMPHYAEAAHPQEQNYVHPMQTHEYNQHYPLILPLHQGIQEMLPVQATGDNGVYDFSMGPPPPPPPENDCMHQFVYPNHGHHAQQHEVLSLENVVSRLESLHVNNANANVNDNESPSKPVASSSASFVTQAHNLSSTDQLALKKLTDKVQKSKPNSVLTNANKKDIEKLFKQRKQLAYFEAQRKTALQKNQVIEFKRITDQMYALECQMIPRTHMVQEYVINENKWLDKFHASLDESINHYQTHADANNPNGKHQVKVKYTTNAGQAANAATILGIVGVKVFFEISNTLGQLLPGAPLIGKALQEICVYLERRKFEDSVRERTQFTSAFNSDFEDMQQYATSNAALLFAQVVMTRIRHELEVTGAYQGEKDLDRIKRFSSNNKIFSAMELSIKTDAAKLKTTLGRTKYKNTDNIEFLRSFGFVCGTILFYRMMHEANKKTYHGNDKLSCITSALNAMLKDFNISQGLDNSQVAYGDHVF